MSLHLLISHLIRMYVVIWWIYWLMWAREQVNARKLGGFAWNRDWVLRFTWQINWGGRVKMTSSVVELQKLFQQIERYFDKIKENCSKHFQNNCLIRKQTLKLRKIWKRLFNFIQLKKIVQIEKLKIEFQFESFSKFEYSKFNWTEHKYLKFVQIAEKIQNLFKLKITPLQIKIFSKISLISITFWTFWQFRQFQNWIFVESICSKIKILKILFLD